jgi:nitroreductase
MTDNTMTRREMLKVSGLTAVVVGGALSIGTGARAATAGVFSAGEGAPYEAWRTLPRDGSPQALVAAAILAANPHNTQPWRFRVSADNIDVVADRSRALPATDPTGSELVAGLGAAIENMSVAAAAAGSTATVEMQPAGAGDALARVALARGSAGENAALFPAILKRHTNRGPYAVDQPVAAASLAEGAALLASLPRVQLSWLQGAERDRFGGLVNQATAAVIADGAQSDEIDRWWRATRDEIDRRRDGMTLDAQSLPPVTLFLGKVLPPQTQEQNNQSWLKSTRDVHVKTAAAFGVLSVEDAGDAESQLQVGRAYQRLHLWATANGLALQPLNQVTERIARDRSQGRTSPLEAPLAGLTPSGQTALFTFRIGHPTAEAGLSPRRRLADVVES